MSLKTFSIQSWYRHAQCHEYYVCFDFDFDNGSSCNSYIHRNLHICETIKNRDFWEKFDEDISVACLHERTRRRDHYCNHCYTHPFVCDNTTEKRVISARFLPALSSQWSACHSDNKWNKFGSFTPVYASKRLVESRRAHGDCTRNKKPPTTNRWTTPEGRRTSHRTRTAWELLWNHKPVIRERSSWAWCSGRWYAWSPNNETNHCAPGSDSSLGGTTHFFIAITLDLSSVKPRKSPCINPPPLAFNTQRPGSIPCTNLKWTSGFTLSLFPKIAKTSHIYALRVIL